MVLKWKQVLCKQLKKFCNYWKDEPILGDHVWSLGRTQFWGTWPPWAPPLWPPSVTQHIHSVNWWPHWHRDVQDCIQCACQKPSHNCIWICEFSTKGIAQGGTAQSAKYYQFRGRSLRLNLLWVSFWNLGMTIVNWFVLAGWYKGGSLVTWSSAIFIQLHATIIRLCETVVQLSAIVISVRALDSQNWLKIVWQLYSGCRIFAQLHSS